MIQYLYGRPGRGKLTYIIDEIKRTKKIRGNVLIIPVGETVNIDKRIANAGISGYVDVYTIPLLCKEIFLRRGGNAKSKISKSSKKMLMYKILMQKDQSLKMFGNISKNDEKAVEQMLNLYRECAQNNIDTNKLESAKDKLSEKDAVLAKKLDDICKIFTEYNKVVEAKWSNSEWDTVNASKIDNDVCKGKNVYIYGFNSLCESEMMLLENVLSKADNICVSFKYDKDSDKDLLDFNSQHKLKRRFDISFIRMRETRGFDQQFREDINLKENKKYTNEELTRLTETLFLPVNDENVCKEEPKHVRVYTCADKREECESVCCDISKSILESEKNGEDLRFANCAVVAASIADYEKELETAFEKYSIPFYMVDEKDIRNEPIIQYIFKCLDCITYDFQMSDILSLVKNGFFDCENDEKDLFEKYLMKWEIKGFSSYENPWTNSPLGFDSRNDRYISSVLEKVNGVREKIYTSFSLFVNDKKEHNAEEHSRRLFNFLVNQNFVKRIKEKANEISQDDFEEGQRLSDIWDGIVNCLDEIVDTFEKEDMFDLDEYIQIIKMCLSEIHARSSKTTLDRVISGSIDKVRFGSVKNLYILGVNDGILPGSKREFGCLTEKEKETLNSTEVLTITDTREKRIFDEIMKFYSVLCIPTTELIMTYHTRSEDFESSNKSIGITYTEEIFPNLKEIVFENVSTDRVWRSDQAFENLIYFSGAEKQAVFDLYKEKRGDYDDRISSFNVDSLSFGEYRIDEDLAKEIFSRSRIETSYSQIEKYIKCQFEYICENYLGAHDDDKASFSAANEGSLIHLIMEKSVDTVKTLIEEKYGEPDFDDEFDSKVKDLIDVNTEEYLKSLMYDSGTMTTEFKNQIRFLKMAAYRALSDAKDLIKDSIFKPMYYELRITENTEKVKSGQAYIEPVIIKKDGSDTQLVINGIIDRVDMYNSSDGKTYVKIIDYKSSERKLSLEMVKQGINTQMLLYLFSIKDNGIKKTNGEILLDKDSVVPAGTVYLHIDSGIKNVGEDDDSNNALVLDSFKDNIGRDVNIRGKNTDDSYYTFENPDKGEKDFESIKEAVSKKLVDVIDNEMRQGHASTFPTMFTKKEADKLNLKPCSYCKFKAVCRNPRKQY